MIKAVAVLTNDIHYSNYYDMYALPAHVPSAALHPARFVRSVTYVAHEYIRNKVMMNINHIVPTTHTELYPNYYASSFLANHSSTWSTVYLVDPLVFWAPTLCSMTTSSDRKEWSDPDTVDIQSSDHQFLKYGGNRCPNTCCCCMTCMIRLETCINKHASRHTSKWYNITTRPVIWHHY